MRVSWPKAYWSEVPVVLEPVIRANKQQFWTARAVVIPTGRITICKVCNAMADTITLKHGTPLATIERIDINAITVMESVAKTATRAQEERDLEWSRLEEMGIKLDNDALTKEEREEFKDLLIENKDLFPTDISQLAECLLLPPFEMHMKDERPIRQRYYSQTAEAKAEIRRQVESLKKNKLVELTQSLFNSPIILVKKSNGSFRMCIDFKKVNQATFSQFQPLVSINEIVDVFG